METDQFQRPATQNPYLLYYSYTLPLYDQNSDDLWFMGRTVSTIG